MGRSGGLCQSMWGPGWCVHHRLLDDRRLDVHESWRNGPWKLSFRLTSQAQYFFGESQSTSFDLRLVCCCRSKHQWFTVGFSSSVASMDSNGFQVYYGSQLASSLQLASWSNANVMAKDSGHPEADPSWERIAQPSRGSRNGSQLQWIHCFMCLYSIIYTACPHNKANFVDFLLSVFQMSGSRLLQHHTHKNDLMLLMLYMHHIRGFL